MEKETTLQKGFGAVEVILIIVILAIIALVGWRVYDMQQVTDATNRSAALTSGNTVDPNAGYVVLGDWGVRFKQVDGLNDTTYYGSDRGEQTFTGQNVETLALTTTKVEAMGGSCASTHEAFTALVYVVRSKEELKQPAPVLLAKVGEYNYYILSAQSACGNNQQNDQAQVEVKNQLTTSLMSLEQAK